MSIRELQAHTTTQEKRKVILMAVLTALVFGGLLKTSGVLNTKEGTGDDAGLKDPVLDLPGEPVVPPTAPAPFPAEALAKVTDNTVHGEREDPACDLLRAYVLTRGEKELRARAVEAPPREDLVGKPAALRAVEAIYSLRGKILSFSKPIPLLDRKSGETVAYRGTMEVGGGPVAFECYKNPHGLKADEYALVRGAFYMVASLEDAEGQPQPPLPLFLAAQVEPDYTPYLRRIKDGEDVHRSAPYWYLVRKVKYDPPETRAASLAPRPTDAELADLGARDALRGRYLEVEGRITALRRLELNAGENRAFLDEIWECELDDDEGRRWFIDSITKPAYEEFVRLHRVKVTGAFALLRTWKDEKGEERRGPHLVAVAPDLALATDAGGAGVPYVENAELLARVTDNTPARDVSYHQLLHKVANMDGAALAAASKKDFSTVDIVNVAERKLMRGRIARVSGRLLRVEPFELSAERRLNPSGITKMYRCYVATSGMTIYTVEVIEAPGDDLKAQRCEVDVDAAFWQVYEFKSKDQQKEKSPWLLGRAAILRPSPAPSIGFRIFTVAGATLALVVLLIVVMLSRREAKLAHQFTQERRAARREQSRIEAEGADAAPQTTETVGDGGTTADPAAERSGDGQP